MIYGYKQILEDFQHLQIIHAKKRDTFLKLTTRLEQTYPCNINDCPIFARHYRDRTQSVKDQQMYYQDKSKSGMTGNQENSKERMIQEHCDRVHSYLLHSMLKFDANGESFDNVEAIKRRNQVIANAKGRSFSKQHNKDHIKRKKKSERYIMKRSSQIADSQEINRKELIKRHKLGIPENMTITEEPSDMHSKMNVHNGAVKDTSLQPKLIKARGIGHGPGPASSLKSAASSGGSRSLNIVNIGISETKSISTVGADEDSIDRTSSDMDMGGDVEQYDESDEEYKLYPGIEEDREWTEKIQTIANDGNTRDQEIFKLLVEHMGIFRWQALHGFHFDQSRATSQIRPSFANIKQV